MKIGLFLLLLLPLTTLANTHAWGPDDIVIIRTPEGETVRCIVMPPVVRCSKR